MDVILLVAALAASTLVAAVFLRGGLIAGCMAVLLAGACFGHAFLHVPLGPLPVTADRILLLLLLVQYVAFRRLGLVQPVSPRLVDWTFLAFLAVLGLSTLINDWRVEGYQPLSKLLFFFAMPAALYWVARNSPITQRSVLWVFGSLAAFGVYLALTAVPEVRGAWSYVLPHYIVSSTHAEFLGRARGPFLNPIANGVVLGTCLCAMLTWWPRLGRAGQLALLALTGLLLLGLYGTLTRSVWIGAAASLVLFIALSLPREARYACVGAAALIGIGALAANWENFRAFKRDRHVSAAEVAESAELRPILAVVAWNMFKDRPLLGCGFGQYDRSMIHYLADRSSGLPLEKARRYVQHNTFLSLLTEVGLVGMTLFAGLLFLWCRDAWRLWHNRLLPLCSRQMGLVFLALLASYLVNAMFHDLTLMPMVTMLMCTLAGMVQALVTNGSRRRV